MNAASENKGSDQGRQRHIPVLLEPVLASLQPRAGQVIVDGTFGAGGYTTAILEQGADVVAIDRDPDAIAAGATLVERFKGHLRLEHGPFSQMEELVGESVDGVVLDIGVSSMPSHAHVTCCFRGSSLLGRENP